MRALLIGGRLPRDSIRIDEAVFIDESGLVAPRDSSGLRILSSELAASDARRIHAEVDRRWRKYCKVRDKFSSRFSYSFFSVFGPLVYWEYLASDFVRQHGKSELVVVGEFVKAPNTAIFDRRSFLQWARPVFWASDISRLPNVKAAEDGRTIRSNDLRQALIESLGYGVRAWRKASNAAHQQIPRRRQGGLPKVLVVAQVAKRTKLCEELRGHFDVVVLDEIVKGYRPGCLGSPVDFSGSRAVFTAAEEFVDALVEEGRQHFAAACKVIDELRPVALITDHEYDPVIRELASREGSGWCPPVAIIPEGAQTLLHPVMRQYLDHWALSDPNVVRFCLTEDEMRHACQAYGQQCVVTGYLGDTFKFSELAATYVTWLLRAGRSGPVALVNVDAHSSAIGFVRPGQATSEQDLIAVDRAVSALLLSGWNCALTCRDPGIAARLRRWYPAGRTTVHVRCPWQLLAKACDVVVQCDSSIGPESLMIGIPAIAWNPFRLPLASQGEIDRGEIYLAQDEAELRSALSLALGHADRELHAVAAGRVRYWLSRQCEGGDRERRPV